MKEDEEFKFTTGRGGGSGKHSYRYASRNRKTVQVSHMPDEFMRVRISFIEDGEINYPILKIDEKEAKLLRIALNAMAVDLQWEDE